MKSIQENGGIPPLVSIYARSLVESLAKKRAIRTPWVRAAFESTFRHHFVPSPYFEGGKSDTLKTFRYDPWSPSAEHLERIYSETPILAKISATGAALVSLSEPTVNALVLENLCLNDHLRIMEVGGGLGFLASLLAGPQGANKVVALEIDEDAAAFAKRTIPKFYAQRGVEVRAQDGWLGVEGSQFDRIVVSATCPDISRAWLRQLADGGRIFVPIACTSFQAALSLQKIGGRVTGGISLPVSFMGLRGSHPLMPDDLVLTSSLAPTGIDGLKQDLISPLRFSQHLAISLVGSCRGRGFFLAEDDVLDGGTFLPGVRADDRTGFAFLGSNTIVWSGDPRSRDSLLETVSHWEKLGRPGIHQFAVEVLERDSVNQPDDDSYCMHLEDHTLRWVLKPMPGQVA